MDTPDSALGTVTNGAPSAEPAPPPAPPVEGEEEEVSRRKKLLLLLLLLALFILALMSAWYLLFRKPITELPIPVVEQPMPTYQYAFYNLTKPQGVAVSADGERIYVTQNGGSLETLMLDRKGQTLGVLKPPAKLIPQAHQLSVALNPVTNEVWTTDREASAVAIYAQDGTFIRIFDQGLDLANWQPLGIGFDPKGNVYVADVSNEATVIHEFGADGKLIRDYGRDASLNHPNGIAVDANGTVYVTDTGNGRLVVFSASGERIGMVGRGNAAGNLGLPIGIGFDDHGRIAIADASGASVQVYAPMVAGDSGPRFVDSFGEIGPGDGQFSYPKGLSTDAQGRVYVADWGNDRLQVWSY